MRINIADHNRLKIVTSFILGIAISFSSLLPSSQAQAEERELNYEVEKAAKIVEESAASEIQPVYSSEAKNIIATEIKTSAQVQKTIANKVSRTLDVAKTVKKNDKAITDSIPSVRKSGEIVFSEQTKASMAVRPIEQVSAIRSDSSVSLTKKAKRVSYLSHITGSASAQIISILHNRTQSNHLDYKVQLPKGTHFAIEKDGSVSIKDAQSKIYGMVKIPWAVDAKGKKLYTYYSIHSNLMRQHIDTSHATFPVVADPNSGGMLRIPLYV